MTDLLRIKTEWENRIIKVASWPRKLLREASDGRWAVDCVISVPLGNGRIGVQKNFWTKKDAQAWIDQITKEQTEKAR